MFTQEALREFVKFVVLDGMLLIGLFYGITLLVALLQQNTGANSLTNRLREARLGSGNVYAALAGAVTPFCSCSTIPVFSGMLRARIRFGIAITFLLASPLVNEAVIIVMGKYFGLTYVLAFVGLAVLLPVVLGIVMDWMGLQKYLSDFQDISIPGEVAGGGSAEAISIPFKARLAFANVLARSEVKAVLPYIMLGLLAGGFIHGFVPEAWVVSLTQRIPGPLLVPIMAVLGAPLYFNMAAAVPIAFALTEKGLSLGAVTAFLVAGAGMSIPEMLLLLKLFKPPFLVAYAIAMLLASISMGYMISFIA